VATTSGGAEAVGDDVGRCGGGRLRGAARRQSERAGGGGDAGGGDGGYAATAAADGFGSLTASRETPRTHRMPKSRSVEPTEKEGGAYVPPISPGPWVKPGLKGGSLVPAAAPGQD
jgi:hypothetical protein